MAEQTNDEVAEAIANGCFFLPESSFRDEGFRIPFLSKTTMFKGRGPVFSVRLIFCFVIPYILFLLFFLLLHFILPDNTPIIGDIWWTVLIPIIPAQVANVYLRSATTFGELVKSFNTSTGQMKWIFKASLPEKFLFFKFKNRVQIIKVVTCHPDPNGGRSDDEYKTDYALITHGMRPLDKFPMEDDPLNNEMITNPNFYDRNVHKMQKLVHKKIDFGDKVPEFVSHTARDEIKRMRYEKLANMRDNGVEGAAIYSFDVDDDFSAEMRRP